MKNDLYVGQKLYIEGSKTIEEVAIKKIGKKYFYLEGHRDRLAICRETLIYKNKIYVQDSFQLYKSKQEILDKKEKELILREIRIAFDWNGKAKDLSLDKLREIAKILEIE